MLRKAASLAAALAALIAIDFPLDPTQGPLIFCLVLFATLASLIPVFAVVCIVPFHSIGRMARHVYRFRTASSARIALHYAPELEGSLDLPCVFDRYHRELVNLTQRFGVELAAPVDVFLFATVRDMCKVFRMDVGGYALTGSNAIVVAAGTDIHEMIRHEFTHLFSAQWNQSAPPLLSEGLSVWMQGTPGGRSIDSAAMGAMRDRSVTLDRLLTSPGLFRERGCRRHSCYLLAGSFTGFLIRHCGWERYRRFYCAVGASDFRETFKKFLGLRLEIAESRWRCQALVHDA